MEDIVRKMITFKEQRRRFTYRIGGIAIHQGNVLFQRSTLDPAHIFSFLPGGRAELGESSEETLKREMREELGVEVTIERLLFVVENLFEDNNGQHHELNLHFLMHFPANCYLYQGPSTFERPEEDGLPLIFDWLPVAQMEQLAIYPEFLRQSLQQIPDQITHIVQTASIPRD